jgi:hypothetical protein
VVLRGAAPTEQIATYAHELTADHDGLLVRSPGDGFGSRESLVRIQSSRSADEELVWSGQARRMGVMSAEPAAGLRRGASAWAWPSMRSWPSWHP